jgi:uncharacterized protein (TIGR03435 family)
MLLSHAVLPYGSSHVIDKTGLTSAFDFKLDYVPGAALAGIADTQTDSGPDLFAALEKQLGLKLQKSKALVDVVVIDHLDKTPSEN